MNYTLFFSGKEVHDGWLDNRYQGHIRVGGNGNGAKEFGGKHGREKDGCRAVGTADYADGSCLLRGKSQVK